MYITNTGERISGNPTLTSLDGEQRAPFRSIVADGWPQGYAASFGVYQVDITPPEGKQWAGTFDTTSMPPTPIFEDIPEPEEYVPEEIEGWQAEVAMRLTLVDPEDEESQKVWDRVQDIISAMPDGPEKLTAQAVLQRGKIRRDSPMLNTLSGYVPLSSARIDDLMRLADSIEA